MLKLMVLGQHHNRMSLQVAAKLLEKSRGVAYEGLGACEVP
jgi:hypothetical protein